MTKIKLIPKTVELLKKLEGPILIFGAGGFVGANILNIILGYRKDVFGVSRDPLNNPRFKAFGISESNLIKCDISDTQNLDKILKKLKPKTIFNLVTYGSYSWEKDYRKTHLSNYNYVIDLIELLKVHGFSAFVNAGSSSEYGNNVNGSNEDAKLYPNSHYSIAKIATSYAINYYGKQEKLPVCNLRLYSVYGPVEDKNRLVCKLLEMGSKKTYPPLVDPNISRDFIFVSDICGAFIHAASYLNDKTCGESFNIGCAKKTTIKQIALLIKNLYKIKNPPVFSTMEKRGWDHSKDWYADIKKAKKYLKWTPHVNLKTGLKLTSGLRKVLNYDNN